ncbi:MAG: leucyl aminopeptidase [Gemmatimonadetes bacterium]|nr:leucyl aminopeptidase [Gemmatimonadota bacterium]
MMKGARKLVSVSADVQPGEDVLIIADGPMQSVADVLAAAVVERGAEPVVAVIRQRGVDATEPPAAVAAAMKSADVIYSAVSISITHTQAMKDALAAGARAIALTAFTEEMLVSGGIDADFARVREDCNAVGERLSKAKIARITSAAGTDLTFSVENRRVNVMPGIVGRGQLSPVPNAEVNVSPVEGTANGTLVVDASIPYLGIGLLEQPIRFTVRDGMITEIEGGDPQQVETLRSAWRDQADPNVYNIAEMGIGMNPMCRFKGLMLEDEGVLGSIHIGTGTNITLGGTVKARSHYDLIMKAPTLLLDGEVLIQDGQIRM